MPSFQLSVEYTWENVRRTITPRVTFPANDSPARPVIVLLHGLSGNSLDMSAPAKHPGLAYDRTAAMPSLREHGWRGYPGLGVWSVAIDPDFAPQGWEGGLNAAGFATVNYSQATPKGPVTGEPLTQLAAVLRVLTSDARFANRQFALVAHSRGGILARTLLVAAHRGTLPAGAGGAYDRTRVRRLVTLHTPNLGSSLAAAGVQVDRTVDWLAKTVPNSLLNNLRTFLRTEVGALAFDNIAAGSKFLTDLAAAEPVPDVQYATWGGTSTVFTRARAWPFTADSALPRWHSPPFYWRTMRAELGELMKADAAATWVPLELKHGIGDLLVTDSAARLPHVKTAKHTTNPINHAEALWDPTLRKQVVAHLSAS